MIKCLACRCHAAEPHLRRVLRSAHLQDWGTIPVLKGKAECLSYLESLPTNQTVGALKMYIEKNSSWAVILGIREGQFDWAEVGHGGAVARLDGQVIAERYGNETTENI